jgi:hypothetical protein
MFMRTHHTKTKGDLGVMAAAYDLTKKGFIVCAPMTEHAPYDLVADRDGAIIRVQVKYRTMTDGYVEVPFKSSWADRHGVHVSFIDKNAVDVFCIFCPDNERCYYVDPLEFRTAVRLRIAPTSNNQRRGVFFADDYLDIPERFRHARQDSNLRTPI